jgi:hypothetical protein
VHRLGPCVSITCYQCPHFILLSYVARRNCPLASTDIWKCMRCSYCPGSSVQKYAKSLFGLVSSSKHGWVAPKALLLVHCPPFIHPRRRRAGLESELSPLYRFNKQAVFRVRISWAADIPRKMTVIDRSFGQQVPEPALPFRRSETSCIFSVAVDEDDRETGVQGCC